MHITCPRCRKPTQFPDGLTAGTPIRCSHCGYSAPYAPASTARSISSQSSGGNGCGVSVLITVVVVVSVAFAGLGFLLPWPIIGLATIVLLVSVAVLFGKIPRGLSHRRLVGTTLVVAALLLGGGGGGGMFLAYEQEQGRLEVQRQRARQQRELNEAIETAQAQENPCVAGADLMRWSSGAGPLQGWNRTDAQRLDELMQALARRCCEKRVEDVHGGLANLNENGPGEGTRYDAIAALGATIALAEERFSSLAACGHPSLVDHLNAAALIETARQKQVEGAWRTYRRVQDLDTEDPELARIVFDEDVRREMAEACLSQGLAAADQAYARRDHGSAEAAYRDVLECASGPASLSAGQRSRAGRRVAEIERNQRRESQRQARDRHRDAQRVARSCISACRSRGGNVLDCADQCAQRHPDVAYEGVFGL